MKDNNKKYWKGLEEKYSSDDTIADKSDFAEYIDNENIIEEILEKNTSMSRRNFLKSLGFGLGTLALASCNKAPVIKSVPYLIKPDNITPGVSSYYTGYSPEGYGILVKTRDGRPIKIEGNPNCLIAKCGANAKGHASLLDLYDSTRLQTPIIDGNSATWEDVDSLVISKLRYIKSQDKKIVILTETITSPTTLSAIEDFRKEYPSMEVVVYDSVSYSAVIQANKICFERAVVPSYHFDKAKVIVSFGADFLGTWLSPVEFTRQYSSIRNAKYLKDNNIMSRHIQFETELSLTGSKADVRIPIRPSQMGLALVNLYNEIAKLAEKPVYQVDKIEFAGNIIEKTARQLWENRGESLVISGSNNTEEQIIANSINSLLGNYGKTIDLDNVNNQYQGTDKEILTLVDEMKAGKVGALLVYGVNPVYSLPSSLGFTQAIDNVPFKVSFAPRVDETAECNFNVIAPDSHPLESWTDANPRTGLYYIGQPCISPIYDTRTATESLLRWANIDSNFYDYFRKSWNKNVFLHIDGDNDKNWESLLLNGLVSFPQKSIKTYSTLCSLYANYGSKCYNSSSLELTFYEHIYTGDGRYANNPLLQECPDPISKVTWDNYLSISPRFAQEQNLKQGDLVVLTNNSGVSLTLPVLLQVGQAYGTMSVALGYGRTASGKAGDNVGVNAFPLVEVVNGEFRYCTEVSLKKTGETYEFARTQTHESLEGRDIVRETTLDEYQKDPYAGEKKSEDKKPLDMWTDGKKSNGVQWGMAIDLNACTGCGSCVVSCNMENNIPVVGRDEVRRRREMHWLRIDRYFSSVGEGEEGYMGKDHEDEAIEVVHQPMLCQHCSHAPCESVCPTMATMHSSDGLNQMVYNRCFGTRYCSNNCPYKVRRFNWFNYADNEDFDYYMNNPMGKLMLNPDVVVRSRGVMEKCTFCIQRIQEGKLKAKMEGRELKDGDIKTACQQSCPANAIVFGDINDPDSEVSKLLKNELKYSVLESTGVQPNIGYMKVVRNKS